MSSSSRAASVPASASSRRASILEAVQAQGFCTVTELAQQLGVSDMTVRRDVQRMESDGLLRAVHGGVTALPQSALSGSGDFADRSSSAGRAKWAIAKRALTYIEPNEVIGMDAGSTVDRLAQLLPGDINLQVITHSLPVLARSLNLPGVTAFSLGGTLHPESQSFGGPTTVATLQGLRINTLFLAASSVNASGVYCGNDFDAVTKRELIKIADRIVLLADSSKFSKVAMVRACALADVDVVIVDDGITDAGREFLHASGARVDIATTDSNGEGDLP